MSSPCRCKQRCEIQKNCCPNVLLRGPPGPQGPQGPQGPSGSAGITASDGSPSLVITRFFGLGVSGVSPEGVAFQVAADCLVTEICASVFAGGPIGPVTVTLFLSRPVGNNVPPLAATSVDVVVPGTTSGSFNCEVLAVPFQLLRGDLIAFRATSTILASYRATASLQCS